MTAVGQILSVQNNNNMKFKEFFLLNENPDDLYMKDTSAITFGFCNNFIFWFDPAHDTSFIPTHVELLLIAKAKHLNKPIEFFIQSAEYRRKLNSFKKLYHEKGHMPLDCVNFLKEGDILYGTTRDDFINDVAHAFLGRLSIEGNVISFWNPPNNFNDHTKQTVKDFLKIVHVNPENLIYNFETGEGEANLSYSQFFREKKEGPQQTKVNTSHIVHMTDPAKKKEALKAMGVMPKPAKGVDARYAMGESFKDHFRQLISEKNYSYNIPSDKELLLYDFYMVTYLNALEKEGKFEPGEKSDTYGQTTSTATHAMGIRDSTLQSFNHIKDQILDSNKENMLDESFFSICCELRHVFDKNQVDDIKNRFGKEIAKIIGHYYINYKKYSRGNDHTYDDTLDRIIKKREAKNKEKYGTKDVAVDNAAYTASYKAAMKTIHQTNSSKEEFVNICKKLFLEAGWNSSYGGAAWASICSAYITLNNSKNEFQKIFAIDNMYHQQHNTGSVFTKLRSYMKDNSHSWILKALDFKADVKENWERVKKIKELLDRDYPGKGLRGVDKMYIEMLKASGDKTYEQYFQTKKPEEKKEDKKKDAANDPNSPAYANVDKNKFIDIAKKYITDEKYKETCKKYRLVPIGFGDPNSDLCKQLDLDPEYIYKDSGKGYKPDNNNAGSMGNSMYFISPGIWKYIFGNDEWHKIKDLLLGKTEEESNNSKLSHGEQQMLNKIKALAKNLHAQQIYKKDDLICVGPGIMGTPSILDMLGISPNSLYSYAQNGYENKARGKNVSRNYFIKSETFIKIYGMKTLYEIFPKEDQPSSKLSEKHKELLTKIKQELKSEENKKVFDEKGYLSIGQGIDDDAGLQWKYDLKYENIIAKGIDFPHFSQGGMGTNNAATYYISSTLFKQLFGEEEFGKIINDNMEKEGAKTFTPEQEKILAKAKQLSKINATQDVYDQEKLIAIGPGTGHEPGLADILGIEKADLFAYSYSLGDYSTGASGLAHNQNYYLDLETFTKVFGKDELDKLSYKTKEEDTSNKIGDKTKEEDTSNKIGDKTKLRFILNTQKFIHELKNKPEIFNKMMEENALPIGYGSVSNPLKEKLGFTDQALGTYNIYTESFNWDYASKGILTTSIYFIKKYDWIKLFGQKAYDDLEGLTDTKEDPKPTTPDNSYAEQLDSKLTRGLVKTITDIASNNLEGFNKVLNQYQLIPIGYGGAPSLNTLYKLSMNELYTWSEYSKSFTPDNFGVNHILYYVKRNTLEKLLGASEYYKLIQKIVYAKPKSSLPPADLSGVTGESFKQHFLNYIKESFDWDNLKYQYSSPENYNLHRLDFFNKQGAVGYIEWDKDDGETEKIYVGEPYRRKGIASHIWEVATE